LNSVPVKFALALLLFVAAPGRAAENEEPRIPPPRGMVNDFAGVLDPGTVQYLERLIGELRAKTGSEIAVVTVQSTKPLTAFDYAMRVAEQWKPGAKDKDNGVVFLIAVRDRELYITTGYGIEGALPDGLVGEIRDTVVVPRFREGNLPAGIRAGTEALAQRIAREYGVTLSGRPAQPQPVRRPPDIGVFAPLLLFFIIILLSRTRFWPLLFLPQQRYRGGYRGGFGGGFGGGGFGGHGGGFGGGGFGGFGGGGFGGGGAGGRW
jgi:uncharacterized protein